MSKNVFGVCLECFSLDGSLGLQVCQKNFFLFGNLLAISCFFIPFTQNNKSKKFFPTFPLFVKNLKKITLMKMKHEVT
jgi:hypothetical protein